MTFFFADPRGQTRGSAPTRDRGLLVLWRGDMMRFGWKESAGQGRETLQMPEGDSCVAYDADKHHR